MGAVTGIGVAIIYRREGPTSDMERWMSEMEEEEEDTVAAEDENDDKEPGVNDEENISYS
jgi:hypothetical protein